MPGRRSFALFCAAALAAALAPAALAGAAVPSDSDRGSARARAEHDRIVAFWTPERMAAATPRDLVRQPDGTFRMEPTKGKPGGGGGGGDGTTCTSTSAPVGSTGSSWPCKGGAVNALTGKAFFSIGSSLYVCSGAVAEDGDGLADTNGRALVLTAGHCVYDQGTGAFVKNWMFYPDYDNQPTRTCADTTWGCWTAVALVAHTTFVNAGSFNDQATTHDFAFAVMGRGGTSGGELDAVLGGEYVVNTSTLTPPVTALGYPQARPYSGADLVYCNGTPFEDPGTSRGTWGLACNMTGGASGGPWLSGLNADGSGGTLVSLNSYKYTGQKDYMYGPKFNGATDAVYATAKEVAGGTVEGGFTAG